MKTTQNRDEDDPTERRKRGAQPGNTNHLKHGFYARQFRAGELRDLEAMMAEDLESEIAMLRVVTRRVMEMATGIESIEEGITLLGAMGKATSRLASLLRTQKLIAGTKGRVEEAISQALTEVVEELKRS